MSGIKEFTLHDGEDEDKTVELHEFIENCGDAVLEWEGSSDGIELTLNVHVNVGDTIVFDGREVTIRRKLQS